MNAPVNVGSMKVVLWTYQGVNVTSFLYPTQVPMTMFRPMESSAISIKRLQPLGVGEGVGDSNTKEQIRCKILTNIGKCSKFSGMPHLHDWLHTHFGPPNWISELEIAIKIHQLFCIK